jgi:acyl-CoA thioesterase-1
MKRFFSRIQQKALNAAEPPVLICAMGDSVTQGVMEHRLLDASAVYHRGLQARLEAFFPSTTFSTINAGVSGETAGQALARLHRDVIRHDPDLVLIAFGLNDAVAGTAGLSRFTDALRQTVGSIRKSCETDLLLLTPPFMASRQNSRIHAEHKPLMGAIFAAQNDGTLALYADAIRQAGSQMRVDVADVHREWSRMHDAGMDTDLWLTNGLNHPDARGHEMAATVIFHRIVANYHSWRDRTTKGGKSAQKRFRHGKT